MALSRARYEEEAHVEDDVVDQATTTASTTAVAAPRPTAVSVANSNVKVSHIRLMKDFLKNQGIALNYGSVKGVKVKAGAISFGDNVKLGTWFNFKPFNWHNEWLVSCNTGTTNPETNELVRSSPDGITLHGGDKTVAEYVQELVEMGYPKAKCEMRGVIFAKITASEKGFDETEGHIASISLSPSSLKSWESFVAVLDVGVILGGGSDPEQVVRCEAVSTENKQKQTYSLFEFKVAK